MKKSGPGVIRLSKEDGVDENLIHVAGARISPLLRNLPLLDYDLKRALVSAYLQGCRDMAETVVKHEPLKETLDYQI